jgi:hypothetical protein
MGCVLAGKTRPRAPGWNSGAVPNFDDRRPYGGLSRLLIAEVASVLKKDVRLLRAAVPASTAQPVAKRSTIASKPTKPAVPELKRREHIIGISVVIFGYRKRTRGG